MEAGQNELSINFITVLTFSLCFGKGEGSDKPLCRPIVCEEAELAFFLNCHYNQKAKNKNKKKTTMLMLLLILASADVSVLHQVVSLQIIMTLRTLPADTSRTNGFFLPDGRLRECEWIYQPDIRSLNQLIHSCRCRKKLPAVGGLCWNNATSGVTIVYRHADTLIVKKLSVADFVDRRFQP